MRGQRLKENQSARSREHLEQRSLPKVKKGDLVNSEQQEKVRDL